MSQMVSEISVPVVIWLLKSSADLNVSIHGGYDKEYVAKFPYLRVFQSLSSINIHRLYEVDEFPQVLN